MAIAKAVKPAAVAPSTRSTRGTGGSFSTAPAKAPRPAASAPVAPAIKAPKAAPAAPAGGVAAGGGGGTGGGGYSGGGIAASYTGTYGGLPQLGADAFAGPLPEDDSWLQSDPGYLAESGGITSDSDALLSELKRQRAEYELDYGNALRNMGYDQATNQWQRENPLGAFGQAWQNHQNDFAGRGMLNSSFAQTAGNNLETSFKRQLDDMGVANTNSKNAYEEQAAGANTQRENALTQAKMNALARRAAGLSLPA